MKAKLKDITSSIHRDSSSKMRDTKGFDKMNRTSSQLSHWSSKSVHSIKSYKSNSSKRSNSSARSHRSIKNLPDWTPSKTIDKTKRIYSAGWKRSLSARKEKWKEVLISKQYDIWLPLGKKNNKKVSYQNHDSKKHKF